MTGTASEWQENIQNMSSGIDTLSGTVSGGKIPVKAASGDFDAGAIVDLATLLTLAGTPSDANNNNTFPNIASLNLLCLPEK